MLAVAPDVASAVFRVCTSRSVALLMASATLIIMIALMHAETLSLGALTLAFCAFDILLGALVCLDPYGTTPRGFDVSIRRLRCGTAATAAAASVGAALTGSRLAARTLGADVRRLGLGRNRCECDASIASDGLLVWRFGPGAGC